MGQDHILLMGNSQFVMAELSRQLRDNPHLSRGSVAWRTAVFFQADGNNRIALSLVWGEIGVCPRPKIGAFIFEVCKAWSLSVREIGCFEIRFNLTQKLLIGPLKLWFDLTVARFNLGFDFFNTVFMNSDFDPRFVFFVAPA